MDYFLDYNSVFELFSLFNDQYFYGSLGCVKLEWSNRMTLSAGLCMYKGGNDVTIRLSRKLLQYRPFSDHINTLLHEMIHAYLFLTKNIRDHDGHGEDFQLHMCRINEMAGTKVTIYHRFLDEVDYFRNHVWKCNGCCQWRPPYYGIVKRAMNRKPSPVDYWWKSHELNCGGSFEKISEPSKSKVGNKRATPKCTDGALSDFSLGSDKPVTVETQFCDSVPKSIPQQTSIREYIILD